MTLSAARRPEILEICRREDILILEDNPYGLLGFDGEPLRALRADEAEGAVSYTHLTLPTILRV